MNDDTPRANGALSLQDRLQQIEEKLDNVLERFQSLPLRVRALEIVLYGTCAIALLAVANSVLASHVTAMPAPAPAPTSSTALSAPVLVK